MRNIPVTVLNADNTASRTGSAIWVVQYAQGSFIVVNGDVTAAGTVKLQGSNEAPVGQGQQAQYVPSAASWADIPSATSTIAAGIGPAIILASMNFQFIRAVYTRTGGGSSTILVSASFLQV